MPPEPSADTPDATGVTPNPAHTPGLSQIRTYQGDVASALSRQNESLVSIQQSEQLKRRITGMPHPEAANEAESKRKDFIFLFLGSIFFITVGVAGAWYGYTTYLERTAAPVLAIPESRLISPNHESSINMSGVDRIAFSTAFDTEVSNINEGELKHVVLRSGATETAPLITTAELLALLESRAPGSLVRAFDKIFMLGALGESRFLIIKLVSFENAFAGMLAWEENLAEDLTAMFANEDAVKAIAPASVFRDVIVRNKDVRILESAASTTEGVPAAPVLLYSFFDNNLLIITDELGTLQTLIERLTRERLSR